MWQGRVIQLLLQSPDFFSDGPDNESIEGDTLLGGPGAGLVLQLGREMEGIPCHGASPVCPRCHA
jgi:hypothetical protein